MTTPPPFYVDFDGIEAAAARLGAASRTIEGHLDRMDRSLKPLQADWTGQAADSYAEAKATWQKSILTMNQLLESLGKAVATSRSGYAEAEQANLSKW